MRERAMVMVMAMAMAMTVILSEGRNLSDEPLGSHKLSPLSCCILLHPPALFVFYSLSVNVELGISEPCKSNRRRESRLEVNGQPLNQAVTCPSRFTLHLQHHGLYNLTLADADGTARSVSFFVAHADFSNGRMWSPASSSLHLDQHVSHTSRDACANRADTTLWVFVAAWNAARWVNTSLSSLRRQTYCNFVCVVVDDASTDDTYSVVQETIEGDDRFVVIRNDRRFGAARNFHKYISEQGGNMTDDDVIVFLDGDDWLADGGVLEHLVKEYYGPGPGCWMTYGSLGAMMMRKKVAHLTRSVLSSRNRLHLSSLPPRCGPVLLVPGKLMRFRLPCGDSRAEVRLDQHAPAIDQCQALETLAGGRFQVLLSLPPPAPL
eukprot:758398-Hanusia_phi.AAC.4